MASLVSRGRTQLASIVAKRLVGGAILVVGMLESSVKIPQRLEVAYWGCAVVSHGAAANHPVGEVVTKFCGHGMHCIERMSADAQGMGFEYVRRL